MSESQAAETWSVFQYSSGALWYTNHARSYNVPGSICIVKKTTEEKARSMINPKDCRYGRKSTTSDWTVRQVSWWRADEWCKLHKVCLPFLNQGWNVGGMIVANMGGQYVFFGPREKIRNFLLTSQTTADTMENTTRQRQPERESWQRKSSGLSLVSALDVVSSVRYTSQATAMLH